MARLLGYRGRDGYLRLVPEHDDCEERLMPIRDQPNYTPTKPRGNALYHLGIALMTISLLMAVLLLALYLIGAN